MNRKIIVSRIRTAVCSLLVLTLSAGCGRHLPSEDSSSTEAVMTGSEYGAYGVFLGINREDISCLDGYETVVIEPSEFLSEDIEALRQDGKTVYAYLNAGAIEQYRSWYEEFKDLTLDVYEDWPDERWIDVSSEIWQDFVVLDLGGGIADMGFDGFFIDNCDVYDEYHSEPVFEGLCSILTGLQQYEMSVFINGGDVFVSETIDRGIAKNLMDGVNQETVFTSIDFDTETYSRQTEEETDYFTEYLERVKKEGLEVRLLEYGADADLAEEIEVYCTENGFQWYNASSLELDGE